MTKVEKKVSVTILNWNTPDMTRDAVLSLLESDYALFDINVFDNGSTKENYDVLCKLLKPLNEKVKIYRIEKNCGYVGGMNFGLETCVKDNPYYFLIINNDTVIGKSSISKLVEFSSSKNDECVVTGKVFHYDRPEILQTAGYVFDIKALEGYRRGFDEKDNGQYDKEEEMDMIDDIFMLYPLSLYKEIGGYNKYFFMNYEQTDLIIRIKKAGYKVYYSPDAKLWHKGSFSTGGLGNPYMMYWEGKSHLIINYLYKNKLIFIQYLLTRAINLHYRLFKGFVSSFLTGSENLKSRKALARGFWAGFFWLFNKKNETGFNPYQ